MIGKQQTVTVNECQKIVIMDDRLMEAESSAIGFLVAQLPAGGKRSRGGEAVPQGRKDRRRSDSGAEDRGALDGGPQRASRTAQTRRGSPLQRRGRTLVLGTAEPGAHPLQPAGTGIGRK